MQTRSSKRLKVSQVNVPNLTQAMSSVNRVQSTELKKVLRTAKAQYDANFLALMENQDVMHNDLCELHRDSDLCHQALNLINDDAMPAIKDLTNPDVGMFHTGSRVKTISQDVIDLRLKVQRLDVKAARTEVRVTTLHRRLVQWDRKLAELTSTITSQLDTINRSLRLVLEGQDDLKRKREDEEWSITSPPYAPPSPCYSVSSGSDRE